MWNFDFQVEARRVLRDGIEPDDDGPTRSERIRALIANDRAYDGRTGEFGEGFDGLSQAVNYVTSHDVGAEGDQRLMNFLFGAVVDDRGLGGGGIENVQYLIDSLGTAGEGVQIDAVPVGRRRRSSCASLESVRETVTLLAGSFVYTPSTGKQND